MTAQLSFQVTGPQSVVFIPGSALSAAPGQNLTRAAQGGVHWELGVAGQITWGGYVQAPAGIYTAHVTARAVGLGILPTLEIFDAVNDCRIYACREIDADATIIFRVYDTTQLEFKFHGYEAGLEITGIELRPLLLEDQACSAETLDQHVQMVLAKGAEAAAVFRLIDRLDALGETSAAAQYREQFVRDGQGSPARVRGLLAQLHSSGSTGTEGMRAIAATEDEVKSELWGRHYIVNDALALRPSVVSELEGFGYQARFIEATRFHRSELEPTRYWSQVFSEEGVPLPGAPRNPLFEREGDIDRSYQTDLALGLGCPAYCPVTGVLLRSKHAFLVHSFDLAFIFYRFEGAETFYLCTGHISAARLFLYMPKAKMIIWIGDPWFRNYDPVELTRWLEFHLVRLRTEIPRYLQNETKLTAAAGNNIIGHYFWHTLTGFEYLARENLLGSIKHIMSLEKTYVPPEDIFPELADVPGSTFLWQDDSTGFAVRQSLLPVHFCDIRMDDTFVSRVRRAAVTGRNRANDPPASFRRPFIWITLRTHTKAWVNQVEGYCRIIAALYEEHGQLTVYLDGMADCVPLADAILSQVPAGVAMHVGLRESTPSPSHPFSFLDMLFWLKEADICIGPIGSNMVFTWQIYDKPSVLHAEHGHLEQMSWLPSMGSNRRPPYVVGESSVTNVTESLYSDYNLDWRVLLDLARKALQDRG